MIGIKRRVEHSVAAVISNNASQLRRREERQRGATEDDGSSLLLGSVNSLHAAMWSTVNFALQKFGAIRCFCVHCLCSRRCADGVCTFSVSF